MNKKNKFKLNLHVLPAYRKQFTIELATQIKINLVLNK